MREEYKVTAENRLILCDELPEKAGEFCGKYMKDKRDILRLRFTLEECLLNWLTEDAIGKTLIFSSEKKLLRKPYIELRFSGVPINPYLRDTKNELGAYGRSTLRTLGLSPTYGYEDKFNVLRFDLTVRKLTTLQQLAMVIGTSVLVGLLGLLLPDNVLSVVRDSVITPVYSTFFKMLNCVAGPMILLSVAWGVYGIGDAATLSRAGKKMLASFIGLDFLVAILAGIILFPLFGLHLSSGGTGGLSLFEIFTMLLNVIPANIVEPFSSGNTLQIIFLGFALGIALLFLGKRTEYVAKAIEQINYLVQFFMELLSKLVPYVVFLVIVSLLWSGTFEVLLTSWKILAMVALGALITATAYYVHTSGHLHIGIGALAKKCLPGFLVAFTTASSAAAFSTNMEVCKKKLGVSDSVSGFGVPLAMVLHKPISVINILCVSFFFAQVYGIECSLSWMFSAVFISAMLAIATPPVSGGGTCAYTLMMATLGIPIEALGIALAIDMLSDFLITGCQMFVLLPTVANVASRIGMIDENILKAKS